MAKPLCLGGAVLCLVIYSMDGNLPGSSVPGDSPGRNTSVGCHALFQGIFPTQRSNPGLPNCRWILYCLSPREAQEYFCGLNLYPFRCVSRSSSSSSSFLRESCSMVMCSSTWKSNMGTEVE